MIRKFHEAKLDSNRDVELWGSGTPMREFLFVEDLADAVVFFLEYGSLPEVLYNVGTGKDITIKSLAMKIQEIVGHKGNITWDSTKPDGTPRKLLDVSKLQDLGWSSNTTLDSGIRSTYEWFLENIESLKEIKL
jgi:GDP-L-fucose synthase